jgi:putative tryptophan/tyrosine transport system substrate-binding protein
MPQQNPMSHKVTIFLLFTFLLATTHPSQAQERARILRIGIFNTGSSSASQYLVDAFRQGLSEHGYVEGRNILIEYRWGEGSPERLPELAADLVRLRVDAILAGGGDPGVRAAKKATSTIPIVMASSSDPVRSGHVASLARPGGNVTGMARMLTDLSTKRLEILKESFPSVSRVAVLRDPITEPLILKDTEQAARSLAVRLEILEARRFDDLENAFETPIKTRVGAVLLLPSAMFHAYRKPIMDLVAKSRLPAMYSDRVFVEAGGLMAYGTNLAYDYRRAAYFVDKILKGANPADLPVERSLAIELLINLKAAKEINLTIPPEVLQRADKVFK